jgi:hypothetical protein
MATREEMMKRSAIFFLITIFITSCSYVQHPKTFGQVKADWDCIPYKGGMRWTQISERLGAPDIAPLPETGTDLSRNTRGYINKVVIFHLERQEVKEAGKVRFYEVVTDIEVCKEK